MLFSLLWLLVEEGLAPERGVPEGNVFTNVFGVHLLLVSLIGCEFIIPSSYGKTE